MLTAGFSSQLDIAKQIAIEESLDNIPKDLVNRVFRQENVSPHTIARIAKVLQVEPYTLYLSMDEDVQLQAMAAQSAENSGVVESEKGKIEIQGLFSSSKSRVKLAFYFTLAIFLIGIIIFGQQNQPEQFNTKHPFQSEIGKDIHLVIVGRDESILESLTQEIRAALPEQFKVSKSLILKDTFDLSPWELPTKLSVDYVLNISIEHTTNMTAIFIDILTENNKEPVFSNVWPRDSIQNILGDVSQKSSRRIEELFGLTESKQINSVIKKKAIVKYMEGQQVKFEGVMNIQRNNQVLNLFQSAINLAPNFIKAQASYCSSKSDEFHLTRDVNMLKTAIKKCEKLKPIASENYEYNVAMGQMYRRIGDLQKAINHFEKAIETAYLSTEIYNNLALAQFGLGAKNSDQKLISDSIKTINRAIQKSPFSWKFLHTKAQIQYSTGDAKGALITQEKSVSLSKNTTSLTNLAAFNFCDGSMLRAKEIYEQILALKDSPLINKHNLASVYTMFKENKKAVALMEEYIIDTQKNNAKVPVGPLVDLADAYNHLSQYDLALSSYQQAYKQIETERLNGSKNQLNEAYLTYTKIAMSTMNSNRVSHKELADFEKRLLELEPNGNNPSIRTILVFSWDLLGNVKKAKLLFRPLVSQCKAMTETPLFAKFK